MQAQVFTHQTGLLQNTYLGLSGIPFHGFITVYFFLGAKKPTNTFPNIHTAFWQVQLLSNKCMLLFPVIKVSFAKAGNYIYLVEKNKAYVFLALRCPVTF